MNIVRRITLFYSMFSVRLAHPRSHITAFRPGGGSMICSLPPLAQDCASTPEPGLVLVEFDGRSPRKRAIDCQDARADSLHCGCAHNEEKDWHRQRYCKHYSITHIYVSFVVCLLNQDRVRHRVNTVAKPLQGGRGRGAFGGFTVYCYPAFTVLCWY